MTDILARLRTIRQRHLFYSRLLTVVFMMVVGITGGVLALLDVALADHYKMPVGITIMLIAALFYKIPYFAYRLNRAWFIKDLESLQLMGDSWRLYKLRILNFSRFPQDVS